MQSPLTERIALVAGATRGAGRGIAVALGRAGAIVYCTGRSSRATPKPARPDSGSVFDTRYRPETIEDTAERVTEAGGEGIAVVCDHSDEAQVAALAARIQAERGRLDILVVDIWGGDALTQWGKKAWELSVSDGRALLERGLLTHIITIRHCASLVRASDRGLIVEITDGDHMGYRGALFYDLVKTSVIRLAFALAEELRPDGVAVLALTPGFLRSEAMLEEFAVTGENWREGVERDPHFAHSESPALVGRAVAALAADPDILARTGTVTSSWHAARRYGFSDANGERPDWGRHASSEALFADIADSHRRFQAAFAEYQEGALGTEERALVEEILVFWLGELDGMDDHDASKSAIWWGGDAELDAEIERRFGALVARAMAGELAHWRAWSRSALALVILLDQFTRNLGRGTPAAFAGDARALAICEQLMAEGRDRELRLIERSFLYIPLMHAEDPVVARRSVEVFQALARDIAALPSCRVPDFCGSAIEHADIVQRFGRYPHRNRLLSREPTEEERAFLADGGPRFGQEQQS